MQSASHCKLNVSNSVCCQYFCPDNCFFIHIQPTPLFFTSKYSEIFSLLSWLSYFLALNLYPEWTVLALHYFQRLSLSLSSNSVINSCGQISADPWAALLFRAAEQCWIPGSLQSFLTSVYAFLLCPPSNLQLLLVLWVFFTHDHLYFCILCCSFPWCWMTSVFSLLSATFSIWVLTMSGGAPSSDLSYLRSSIWVENWVFSLPVHWKMA